MTDLLYLTDQYLKEFEATVTEAQDMSVVLDRTAFYPRGGGLPSDTGRLLHGREQFGVQEVYWQEGRVLHRLDGQPPSTGSGVKGVVNWEERYAVMRHHSAVHVLCGAVYRLYGALITGGQVHRDRARIDFDLEDLSAERVRSIEEDANRVIREGSPILVRFMSREEALEVPDLARTKTGAALIQKLETVRVVEIKDYDAQADGGPHVANTREIGGLRVTSTESKGRHNKRIEFVLE